MKGLRRFALTLLVCVAALPCFADEPHQHEHGAPPEKLGKVDFEVSCSAAARPQFERGVRWNDPAFSIAWPDAQPTINARDASYPDFQC